MDKLIIIIILIFTSFHSYAIGIELVCDGIKMKVDQHTSNGINSKTTKNLNSVELIFYPEEKKLIYGNTSFEIYQVGNTVKYKGYLDFANNDMTDPALILNRANGNFEVSKVQKIGDNVYFIEQSYNCKKKEEVELKF